MSFELTYLLTNTSHHQPDVICATLLSGDDEQSLTYRQASRSLSQHVSWLEEAIRRIQNNASDDTVIAFLSSNSVDFILSVLASSSFSLPSLLLNTRWSASEMTTALQAKTTSAVTFLLYAPEFRERAHEIVKHANHAIHLVPIPTFALQQMRSSARRKDEGVMTRRRNNRTVSIHPYDYSSKDAVIVFTSGTSQGRPKGVRLSHRAIAVQCWAKCQLPCGYSCNTKMLASTVPFFHIGGLSSLLAVWMAGGQIVLPLIKESQYATGFDPEMVWRSITPNNIGDSNLIRMAHADTLVVVPAMLFLLQQQYQKDKQIPNHSVRLILVGGQSITHAQKVFLREAFPAARVVQTYACTEAASSLTFHSIALDQDTQIDKSRSDTNIVMGDCVGSPPNHVEICLIDKDFWIDHGKIRIITRPWSAGIIATKGPHVMNGYWMRGLENQVDRPPDQFFVTNDLAYWDENGQLYFSGRVNDSIRTGGETVMASEVERVLQLHPHIDDCAVFPVPDPKFGEAVACAIVSSQGSLTLQQIRTWCHERGLSSYKHPRHILIMKKIPKNSSGKTLKFRLMEQFTPEPKSKL